jgi:high affinity sulfate transporter 1
LVSELLAGVSLAAMNIPQALGYARIAGTPVITGLYTLLFPVVAFALLGGARYLFVAADSATAVILATGVSPMARPGTADFLAHASVVALMAGILLFLARVLRLGFLADFLSRSVLIGFLTGVGFQVGIAVLGQIVGIHVVSSVTLQQLLTVVMNIPAVHLPTLLVSVCVLAIILVTRIWTPKVPGSLLAVLGTIFLSYLLDFGGHGIKLIGPVEGGLPKFMIPVIPWQDFQALIPVAGACFIMIITQSSATARAFGVKKHLAPDENRDLLGLGAANAVAGLTGTFVVNGSPTQTAMLESCGGRSQIANLGTAATVAIILFLLTGPLKFLPLCVLGSIVLIVALGMIDIKGLGKLRKCSKKEFFLALGTALSVVILGVEYGICLAIVISLLEHVQHSYHPPTAVILRGTVEHWRMEKALPGHCIEPGVVLYWFGADLYYANSTHFCSEIRDIAWGTEGLRALIVDCGAITAMDYSAGQALAELQCDLADKGVTLAMARVTSAFRSDMDIQGISNLIGQEHIYLSRKKSLVAFKVAETGV